MKRFEIVVGRNDESALVERCDTYELALESLKEIVECEYNHLARGELKEYNHYVIIEVHEDDEYIGDIDVVELYADRYAVRCSKNGDEIEYCATVGDAERTIEMYESDDKEDRIYEEGFYEIYDRTLEEVI